MYSTLPSDMLRNFIVPTKNPYLHAAMAVTIIPKGVTIHGYVAEQSATKIAKVHISKYRWGILDELASIHCNPNIKYLKISYF